MSTKYIFQSGGVRNFPYKKKRWHQEMIKTVSGNPKVLICLFAIPRELWEGKYPSWCASFQEDMAADITAEFKMASPKTFVEDCLWADIMYCPGGDDALAKLWLSKFDLKKLWQGKVVCVNSATSDALSTHYFTCDWRECQNGLGIVPIKFLPHYRSNYGANDPRGPVDWEQGLADLKAYGDTSLPVHALEEGDFVVIEQ